MWPTGSWPLGQVAGDGQQIFGFQLLARDGAPVFRRLQGLFNEASLEQVARLPTDHGLLGDLAGDGAVHLGVAFCRRLGESASLAGALISTGGDGPVTGPGGAGSDCGVRERRSDTQAVCNVARWARCTRATSAAANLLQAFASVLHAASNRIIQAGRCFPPSVWDAQSVSGPDTSHRRLRPVSSQEHTAARRSNAVARPKTEHKNAIAAARHAPMDAAVDRPNALRTGASSTDDTGRTPSSWATRSRPPKHQPRTPRA